MSEEEQQAKKVLEEVPDPDLDNLLDDAIQDFNRPQLPKPAPVGDLASKVAAMGIGAATSAGTDGAAGNVWTEEFIQQATSNFEQTMRAIMEQQQGSGGVQKPATEGPEEDTTGGAQPFDLSAMSAQFAKFAEAASKTTSEAPPGADFVQCLDDTMKQLRDDLSKMFENLGLMGDQEGDGAVGGLFPLMQVMLENILSKEVLYPSMKEITDKLQEMGQPPKELVGDMGPMLNFDEAGNPVLPDVSALLGAAGLPGSGPAATGASGQQPADGEQCSLM
ncbi:Peroxisomal biogenesis factor 19-like [Homarus americanus]|uniref:Peroxin-19 n=1 Tax=Homarus americanus TaxID=6706 RepID=A0A8J5ND80_HOMAM|nr:Peroxisomal biogenesis factor 19-like [Homarus americanus]